MVQIGDVAPDGDPPRAAGTPTPEPGVNFWSERFDHRQQVRRRWKRIYRLPVRRRSRDVIQELLRPDWTVLDYGAGEAALGRYLKQVRPDITYRSLDVDERRPHDYRCLEDVREPVQVVVCEHVLEHLTLAEGNALVQRFFDLLPAGGLVVLNIPNIYHPTHYWEDAEHRTAYAYAELGALLTLHGFQLRSLWRIYHEAFLRKLLRRYLGFGLFALLSLDYAHDVVAVGQKPATTESPAPTPEAGGPTTEVQP